MLINMISYNKIRSNILIREINKLKIFISYSHIDEECVINLKKHMAPLSNKESVIIWHDRKIIAGDTYQKTIDNNLNNADIIFLIISANFLCSNACLYEKEEAFRLEKDKGIRIIPIIYTNCNWLLDEQINPILALPQDGKPLDSFPNINDGYVHIVQEIQKVIIVEKDIKSIQLNNSLMQFLEDTDLLKKAHPKKDSILLDDIYIAPDLDKYESSEKLQGKVSANDLLNELYKHKKIIIVGEGQSGKTTICKKLFRSLFNNNYFPVYINGDQNYNYSGKIENKIRDTFKSQYQDFDFDKIKCRIIPILDNFYLANDKEKILLNLKDYSFQIIVVDELFSLNISDETLVQSFVQYNIRQCCPSQRNDLIKKWISLDGEKHLLENDKYKTIDNYTELIESTLGKILSIGIMPSYPFFILTVLSSYETMNKPLNETITSQGYCYQALIILYLKKLGLKSQEIDTYINFLSVIAYYFFRDKKNNITYDELLEYMIEYKKRFILNIMDNTLISNLQKANFFCKNCLGYYSFKYQYLYYFFVAKYLSDHVQESVTKIEEIAENLQNDENAYILIFLSHHSKDKMILESLIKNATNLFEGCSNVTLEKKELVFFDEKLDSLVKAALKPITSSPEKARKERLKRQDILEQTKNLKTDKEKVDENKLAQDLRRSIKTVEVMGRIVKNRSGSLEISDIKNIIKNAINIHLRIISYFINLIKVETQQNEMISQISKTLDKIVKDNNKKISENDLEKIAKTIFWNLNFRVIYGYLFKAIHSIGSSELKNIITEICDDENTPATFIIKQGILMWYDKNLQIDEIYKTINKKNFSPTAEYIIKFQIVHYCSFHTIDFKERQKLEGKFQLSSENLLK